MYLIRHAPDCINRWRKITHTLGLRRLSDVHRVRVIPQSDGSLVRSTPTAVISGPVTRFGCLENFSITQVKMGLNLRPVRAAELRVSRPHP